MHLLDEKAIAAEGVGDRVRLFRRERGMTQEQLGLAIGAGTAQSAKAMIAKVERGQIPGGLRLQKIAKALHCSADILLSGTSRELFEVIRYAVRPAEGMQGAAFNAFRVARMFLCFAMDSGDIAAAGEFLDMANRLFFLAGNAPLVCHRLFEILPGDNPGQLVASGIQTQIRDIMQESGREPAGYKSYRFAAEAAALVRRFYVQSLPAGDSPPAQADQPVAEILPRPSLPLLHYHGALGSRPQAIGKKELAQASGVVLVQGDGMEPVARNGQYAMVADQSRRPEAGEIVACWHKRKGVLFRRFVQQDSASIMLMPVTPTGRDAVRISPDDITAMRVIVGVLFE